MSAMMGGSLAGAARGIAAVLLVAGLAACDQGPAVSVNYSQGEVVWTTFVYAGSKGPVLTEIHGNPLAPRPIEDLVGLTLPQLKRAVPERVTEFTVYPEEAPARNIRLILVFDPAPAQSGGRLCAGEEPAPSVQAADRITLRAVFCADGDRLSDVQGWIKRGEHVDEDKLRQLVLQAADRVLDVDKH